MSTLYQKFITSVRELSYDRFVTNLGHIQHNEGVLTISDNMLKVVNGGGDYLILDFSPETPVIDLINVLIVQAPDIVLSLGPSFYSSTDLCSDLVQVSDVSIDSPYAFYKKNFFSESTIAEVLAWFIEVHDVQILSTTTEEIFDELGRFFPVGHFATWCAYRLLEKRRVAEKATMSLDVSVTKNGITQNPVNTDVTVNATIGNLSLSENPSSQDFARIEKIGSENVFGDESSFWYRLQLHLRGIVEQRYKDFSLRPDVLRVSDTQLEKTSNYLAHFDSYPYTLSPYTRGLLDPSHTIFNE
ncbi:hypothetical protein [Flammeovirga agarivorans]|uniref:Uncharacterized protein n=1 Tax=Flammeovirga agarivorans TaxID=2726742 RepID=A0A7X8SRF0_9BACT|nr:hypothetical protein [Flammeovirga agarivorans]NLR94882.1 hypothetical protein [Flammeovirga agarivorans]